MTRRTAREMAQDRLATAKRKREAVEARIVRAEADARFVAAAREDVPWLVSLVESLTAERDALAREADALRAKVAAVEALPDEWMALTSTVLATKQEHWRGDDYVDGREFGIETCADSLRAALATTGEGQ